MNHFFQVVRTAMKRNVDSETTSQTSGEPQSKIAKLMRVSELPEQAEAIPSTSGLHEVDDVSLEEEQQAEPLVILNNQETSREC